MIKLFTVLIASLLFINAGAQSRLVTAQFQKGMAPAIENDIPFPEKLVNKTIEDQFLKLGYRGKDYKGYLTFKSVHLPQLGNESYDLYFKTARKSKKEKESTTVTMLMSAGYEKFIGDTTDARTIQNGKKYLDSLTEKVAAFDLEQQITEQGKLAEKSTKKLNNIVSDGQDLQKKKNKLDNDIINNLRDQANQKAAADKDQQILQSLRDKRMQ